MSDILYSFIIPHHNNPDLLNRLIETIPCRDDIEVIVVDDNSLDDLKPHDLRSDCKCYFVNADETKGAGKARNIGMEKAQGKWLLFADSDDLYEKGFIEILDKYSSKDIDILYFDVYYTWDLEKCQERWPQRYSESITNYLKNRNSKYWLLMIKHIIQGPWNFMVRSNYVQNIGAKYEEVPKGNDAYFHHYVAMNTDKCDVVGDKLYYWLWSDNGITHKKRDWNYYLSAMHHKVSHIKMRVAAGAWDTIPPLHKDFGRIRKELGLFYAVRFVFSKLTSGLPWHKIWWHKLFDRRH